MEWNQFDLAVAFIFLTVPVGADEPAKTADNAAAGVRSSAGEIRRRT
jgi:hypothetical protein